MSEKKISYPMRPLWDSNAADVPQTPEIEIPNSPSTSETGAPSRAQIYAAQRNLLAHISTRAVSAESTAAKARISNWLARHRRAARK